MTNPYATKQYKETRAVLLREMAASGVPEATARDRADWAAYFAAMTALGKSMPTPKDPDGWYARAVEISGSL